MDEISVKMLKQEVNDSFLSLQQVLSGTLKAQNSFSNSSTNLTDLSSNCMHAFNLFLIMKRDILEC